MKKPNDWNFLLKPTVWTKNWPIVIKEYTSPQAPTAPMKFLTTIS